MRTFIVMACGAAAWAVAAAPATACKGPVSATVREEYEKSEVVFLGRATEVKQELLYGSAKGDPHRIVRERVVFVVEKGWKNAKVGDHIQFDSEIGVCGLPALNDPVVFSVIENAPNGGHLEYPLNMSGRWLVYAYGPPPYSLISYSRSQPVEGYVTEDLNELEQIVQDTRR